MGAMGSHVKTWILSRHTLAEVSETLPGYRYVPRRRHSPSATRTQSKLASTRRYYSRALSTVNCWNSSY